MSHRIRVVVAVAAILAMQSGVSALALSGTATITRLDPISGPAGTAVAVVGEGCVETPGTAIIAKLFVRGPGASTAVVSETRLELAALFTPPGVTPLPPGSFIGSAGIPPEAATGSVYKVSAQCAGGGGLPLGPESPALAFTVTGPALAPGIANGGLTGTNGPASTSVSSPRSGTITGGSTTGRATPISRTPQFTG